MTSMRKRIVSAAVAVSMMAGAAACTGTRSAADLTGPDMAAPKDTSDMIPVNQPDRMP
jgi:hypothetical protein